jgi:hypothetical protein
MKITKQSVEESNAYSLFVYSVRSQVISDYYLRRLLLVSSGYFHTHSVLWTQCY